MNQSGAICTGIEMGYGVAINVGAGLVDKNGAVFLGYFEGEFFHGYQLIKVL